MSGSYGTRTKTARMTATRNEIDLGSGPGVLQIGTAGMALVLRDFTLNDPCGAISGDTLTFAGFPKTDATGPAGTAAEARIVDSDGVVIRSGMTVGVGAGFDVQVDSVTLALDQSLAINSAAIQHAA